MNILERLNKTRFLKNDEIRWLVGDIVAEFDCDSAKSCSQRRLIAWFLRNAAYLPYKKISDVLEYYRAPQAYFADMSFVNSTDVTFSISGYEKENLDLMKKIADDYYGCQSNLYLDRISDPYLSEALLYCASKACGVADKKSNYNSGFSMSKTPDSSQLVNLKELLEMVEESDTPTDVLNAFEIIKNE